VFRAFFWLRAALASPTGCASGPSIVRHYASAEGFVLSAVAGWAATLVVAPLDEG